MDLLSGRQAERVPRGVREHLHPWSGDFVWCFEKRCWIRLFLGSPEGMGFREGEDEKRFEGPVGRLGGVVVLRERLMVLSIERGDRTRVAVWAGGFSLTSLINKLGYPYPIDKLPSLRNTSFFWVNHRIFRNNSPLTTPHVKGFGSCLLSTDHLRPQLNSPLQADREPPPPRNTPSQNDTSCSAQKGAPRHPARRGARPPAYSARLLLGKA